MTSTWRRVIRLAVEWSRERVGIWSKTAWSGQGCAGCRPVRKRCWTYEPPTSMASGMPSGTSTSRRRINGFTAKYGTLGEVNPVVTPNENLNAAEDIDYHILLDWSVPNTLDFFDVRDGQLIWNGYHLWNCIRQILAKFITGLDSMVAIANRQPFSITIEPKMGSIVPERRPRKG